MVGWGGDNDLPLLPQHPFEKDPPAQPSLKNCYVIQRDFSNEMSMLQYPSLTVKDKPTKRSTFDVVFLALVNPPIIIQYYSKQWKGKRIEGVNLGPRMFLASVQLPTWHAGTCGGICTMQCVQVILSLLHLAL